MNQFGKYLLVVVWALSGGQWATMLAAEPSAPAADVEKSAPADTGGSHDATDAGQVATSPSAAEIATWIKGLDDQRYQVREESTQHLLDAGAATLDQLLAVSNGGQPEPADRAIFILRKFGKSHDDALANAALNRLIQLQNRPALVAKAEQELAERSVAACEQRLEPLGAELSLQVERLDFTTEVSMLTVRLGDKWHGTLEDLKQICQLEQQRNFRLVGAAVNDDVARLFVDKENLSILHLIDTKVTPDVVDAIKEKHPDATVYVRNQAMLGVAAESNKAGVAVKFVQQNSGASAAGVQIGDVIVSIDGHKLPDFDRLTARIAQHQPGDKIDVEILRNEKTSTVQVTLGARPAQE
jgi:hypothetical protein